MQLLTIIFLIVGIILLGIELIVPGFGIFGISGIISILISWIMTVSTFKFFGITIVLFEIIFISIGFYMLFKKMKKMQLFGRIILSDSNNKNKKDFANLEEFIGREGITRTALRPAGDAEFNGITIEVVSDSGYIDNNTRIKVTKFLENKLYVKPLNYN